MRLNIWVVHKYTGHFPGCQLFSNRKIYQGFLVTNEYDSIIHIHGDGSIFGKREGQLFSLFN